MSGTVGYILAGEVSQVLDSSGGDHLEGMSSTNSCLEQGQHQTQSQLFRVYPVRSSKPLRMEISTPL